MRDRANARERQYFSRFAFVSALEPGVAFSFSAQGVPGVSYVSFGVSGRFRKFLFVFVVSKSASTKPATAVRRQAQTRGS